MILSYLLFFAFFDEIEIGSHDKFCRKFLKVYEEGLPKWHHR